MLAFCHRISYDKVRTCDWRNVERTTGEHVIKKLTAWAPERMLRRFFMYKEETS